MTASKILKHNYTNYGIPAVSGKIFKFHFTDSFQRLCDSFKDLVVMSLFLTGGKGGNKMLFARTTANSNNDTVPMTFKYK